MALKDTWKDKQDGVDDILAEDINDIAHAAIDNEQAIEDIKNIPNAGYETKNVSLVGITTSSKPDTSTITENQLISTTTNTSFYIAVHGQVDIELVSTNRFSMRIDGNNIGTSVDDKLNWSGYVDAEIRVIATFAETITFEKFIGTTYTDGLMTGEQAEKLENTYTKEESHNLFAEKKVATETTVETTLEELTNEGKTSGSGNVNGNKWTSIGADSFTINVQGKVSFSGVTKSEYAQIYIDGKMFEGTDFNGVVESGIVLNHEDFNVGSVEFASFSVAEYVVGLMSEELLIKLDASEYVSKENKKEIELLKVPASVTSEHVSLLGITTGGSGNSTNTVTDNIISESTYGTYNIDFQGEAKLKVSCVSYNGGMHEVGFYIDDVLITSDVNYDFEWSGIIKQGIKIVLYDGTVTFEQFDKVVYVGGLMSSEDKQKLENTYDKTEVKNLIDESIGEALEGDY